ncbi:MAG: DUF1874 domain-containing protein [Acidobacteriota bacterium]
MKQPRYLTNAFSLNMLEDCASASISVQRIGLAEARKLSATTESIIGHADTARVVSRELGREVPARRATVTLSAGTSCLIAQYRGPRLPEGATELPEGSELAWLMLTVDELTS